ncbi:hypothetical protein ccbrp13_38190 [Ktedonobacteria bacterium brp13]|nr:hypothetical protein ccbrp13_38190 [Ktedonobacteria bacterium brp13]
MTAVTADVPEVASQVEIASRSSGEFGVHVIVLVLAANPIFEVWVAAAVTI